MQIKKEEEGRSKTTNPKPLIETTNPKRSKTKNHILGSTHEPDLPNHLLARTDPGNDSQLGLNSSGSKGSRQRICCRAFLLPQGFPLSRFSLNVQSRNSSSSYLSFTRTRGFVIRIQRAKSSVLYLRC